MSCLDKEVVGEFDDMVADESPTNFKKVDAQRRKRQSEKKKDVREKKMLDLVSREGSNKVVEGEDAREVAVIEVVGCNC